MLATSVYQTTPLNTSEISAARLNIANKTRCNPLSWNGQFSPQLVQVLLQAYATAGMQVFDPFLGSGTLLLEAGRAKLAASGTEINPGAIVLAQTYQCINMAPSLRRAHLEQLRALLEQRFPRNLPLFRDNGSPAIEDEATLKSRLIETLESVDTPLERTLLETLVALVDFYKPGLSNDRILGTFHDLTQHIDALPYSKQPINIYHADARATPLAPASVDLVITSPPYINVFNYHQQYRASMEALRWNLLRVAKSEIGANRKHRGNRFLTVIQYCLDIAQTLSEMARICKPTARLIFVVGRESAVRGTRIFNGEIVAEIANRAMGFEVLLRQERVFLNRFGQDIFEDILHFAPSQNPPEDFLPTARDIAVQVLKTRYDLAPVDARKDIQSAIRNVQTVKPSPIFELSQALAR